MSTQDLRREGDSIASRRTDTIRRLTVDQRAGFLLELAEHVDNEAAWPRKPFTDVLPSIVPAVASACCPDPLAAFDRLVEAVAEQRAFNADPAGYADAHELSTCATSLDRLFDRLSSDVDAAVQELLSEPTSTRAASA